MRWGIYLDVWSSVSGERGNLFWVSIHYTGNLRKRNGPGHSGPPRGPEYEIKRQENTLKNLWKEMKQSIKN